MKRYLITTADERTWVFDRPAVFLGSWCCLHSRQHIWAHMNAEIAEPYGLGQATKELDLTEVRALENALFPLVCSLLNSSHGVTKSERYWKIILGHWYRRCVETLFNRVRTVQKCLAEYEIDECSAYVEDGTIIVPSDSMSSIAMFSEDHWNQFVYSKFIEFLDEPTIRVWQLDHQTEVPQLKIKRQDARLFNRVSDKLSFFSRESDALIVNSYLPKHQEILLQLLFAQSPRLIFSPSIPDGGGVDSKLRAALTYKLRVQTQQNDVAMRFIASVLFALMPLCYIEKFAETLVLTRNVRWPKHPRFIFTSNNFDTDDVFKVWVAERVECGVPYFIGQHGADYGTHRYYNPSVEESIADKFFTWGWSEASTKYVPAFIFKLAARKKTHLNKYGGLLLIEKYLPDRFHYWDTCAEFAEYFSEQQKFISMLEIDIRSKTTIRLHSSFVRRSWGEVQRWREFDLNLFIEPGKLPIRKLIKNSRLVVHSYDSTGLLEALSQNIATVAFWQNGLEHVCESAQPWYQKLVDVRIIHLSTESTAKHINAIWDDVDQWWNSLEVQSARKLFCERYAKISPNPLVELKELLIKSEKL